MATNSKNQVATKSDLKKLRNEIKGDLESDFKRFRGEIKEDFKNYTGLLHEQFSDQVKLVAEQYTSIDRRLTKVETRTEILMETVAEIKMDTTMIREELENKADKAEVKKLGHRVAVLEART